MTKPKLIVGLGTCGISAGAQSVYEAFEKLIDPTQIELQITSCNGQCFLDPLVDGYHADGSQSAWTHVTPDQVPQIIEAVLRHAPIEVPIDRISKQNRVVLENCGIINPESINDYKSRGGYLAWDTVKTKAPQEIVEIIKASGLRGRGGAGFSTGMKWQFALANPSKPKVVIANADEGDPGAFMDRAVLEGDPHRVIEGLLIAAYATGATSAYIYVRAEYPLAIKRLRHAIKEAEHASVFGDISVGIKEGAGAFVCGEETALMASMEGGRGMPRIKPPFPAESGLWGQPTTINNVETLAAVPWIIRHGADAFASLGAGKSRGTKVFSLAGKVKYPGLVEIEMGTSLRTMIEDLGGGTSSGLKVKAVQMGGPSGGCVPESLLDTPLTYEDLQATGAIMGSGGVIVMDEATCMIDIAKFFLNFIQNESCGKCTFCRIGTKRMYEIMERITDGKGKLSDIDELMDLSTHISQASLCQLGKTAPNPVLTTLKYFKDEYLEHIVEKKCRAKVCKPLIRYIISPDKCTGCTLCAKRCPVFCITGNKKETHYIDAISCTKCGVCFDVCRFGAVEVVS
jgi:NADH-quinone oxidoreductase subunit F